MMKVYFTMTLSVLWTQARKLTQPFVNLSLGSDGKIWTHYSLGNIFVT